MSGARRKARPLNRDQQVYRDDRLYLVACDDTYAPKQYFDAYKEEFLKFRLHVEVVPTTDGTSAAEHVLNRLLEIDHEPYDDRWLLLDTDHYTEGNHRKSFIQALGRARKEGVQVAVSKPCFEFWLLLHHLKSEGPELGGITDAGSVSALLKQILGTYNKRALDMTRFPLQTVPQAVIEAGKIDRDVRGGDIPERTTSRVYRLWEAMVGNASPAQIPEELAGLKNYLSNQGRRP